MDITRFYKFALDTATKAGKILMDNYGTNFRIDFKNADKFNLVTEIDKKTEDFIVGAIKKAWPNHCVLSEEGGDCGLNPSNYRWIIDPLDGTTNYSHGHPFFAVSIGLEIDGEILAGVVYAPFFNEMFSAKKGAGAFLNNRKIHVSKNNNLATALLGTGLIHNDQNANLKHFQYFLKEAQGIRRCGAAAIDLCYTAAGRLDGFWEPGLWPWDVAAGKLIVEEAGGKITAMDGKKFDLEKPNILATNGTAIHQKMATYFIGS